jgi:hypothetical protein
MFDESVATLSQDQWADLSGLLDQLVARLRGEDRAAVLQRFYQRKSLSDVGLPLGISEEAARKRVARAVERLRELFAGKGITVGSAALAAGLATYTTQSAPAAASPQITSIAKGAMPMMTKKLTALS